MFCRGSNLRLEVSEGLIRDLSFVVEGQAEVVFCVFSSFFQELDSMSVERDLPVTDFGRHGDARGYL